MSGPTARREGPNWRLRVTGLRYQFRESLFLLPALVMIGGILLAIAATAVDNMLGDEAEVPLTLAMSSNAATWLVATVAGAMITTVGVVFSLTVVSLQLASSQFSPRVMRSFIRDRLSQGVIGLLVGTFFYCVLILPSINGEATAPAPRIAVTLAVVLTLVTVVGIIAHLDHLARGLQVGNLARAISVEGRDVVTAAARTPTGLHEVRPDEHPIPEDASAIPSRRSGWVSQVDAEQMLRAVDPQTTVRLDTRVGAYIHEGEPLFTVHPTQSQRTLHTLAEAIDVTAARTMLQDVDFAIRQLVDIGLRALSPAVNDPTTAVEILLRLGTLMRKVLTSPLAPLAIRDEQGRVLVQPWNLHPDELVEHAFDQLRQSCLDQPEVVATLLRVLRMLIAHVHEEGCSDRAGALEKQMHLTLEMVSRQPGVHPKDLERLQALSSDETDPADHSR